MIARKRNLFTSELISLERNDRARRFLDTRTPGAGPGVRAVKRMCYLVVFRDVRRQRVQTRAFVSLPFSRMVKGWRLGW
jgi:hypothetical protein